MTHTEEQGQFMKVNCNELRKSTDKMLGGFLFEGVFHLCLGKFLEETESQIMNVFAEKGSSLTWSNNYFKSVSGQPDRLK